MNAPGKIYISYTRNDKEFVGRLVNELQALGANIFLDQFDITVGSSWDYSLNEAVKAASIVLVILSPDSINSKIVMEEVAVALRTGKSILPVLIESCEVPTQLRKLKMLDFTGEYHRAFNNLLEALGLRAPIPLALQLIEENKIIKSPRLDLSNCGMSEIPQEIGELKWLEELIIAGNAYYDYQYERIIRTANQGEENNFTTLPVLIKNLKQLKKLVIQGSEQRMLIRDISIFQNLTNLEFLDVSYNRISELLALSELHKLKYLILNNTAIQDLSAISTLTNLSRLVISTTNVTELSPISHFINLKLLNFSTTAVTNIFAISNLENLSDLNFSFNKIRDISPLSTLNNLRLVDFTGCPIKEISAILDLKSLEVLRFDNCDVTNLLGLASLKNLKTFYCKGNPISDCPADVYETGDPKQLRAYFNAKKAEDVSAGMNIGSFGPVETPKSETDLRRDVKLIILGNSNVGKTNLVNYLQTGTFTGNRKTTHGLEVHKWLPDKERFGALGDIAVSIWDFGGQEYYHEAYRLFLSSNAVYLLLWCNESNNNSRLQTSLNDDEDPETIEHFEITYWLDTIQHYSGLGRNLPGAPTNISVSETEVRKNDKARLIAVQNKVDNIDKDKERIAQDLHRKYRISDSFHISLLEGSDTSKLQQNKRLVYFLSELETAILNNADIEKPPAKWQLIRSSILSLKDGNTTGNPFHERLENNPWISLDDFKEACKSLAIELTDDEVYTLPRWLEKGGVVVYFPNIPELSDKVFLRPDNLAKNIYKILSEKIRRLGGEFSADDLFNKEEKEEKTIFLELAKQLDLVFPHPVEKSGKDFLAPQYLPDNHPIEDLFKIASQGAWQSQLWIKVPLFYYKKILHGLLLHFASEEETECRYFWKHGIMFVNDGLRVLIKGLYPDRLQPEGIILFGVEYDTAKRDALLKKIFDQVLQLLAEKSNSGASANEKGNLSTGPNPKSADPKTNRTSVDIQVSYDGENYISYIALLDNPDEPKAKAGNSNKWLIAHNFAAILPSPPQKAKRIFLSYSHQNTKWLVRLRTHLSGIRRAKLIESWDDKEILPGDQWDAIIKKNMEEADIFILLLSADFIASEYIWNEELSVAFRNMKLRNAIVIPVLFEPLDLGGLSEISTSDNLSFKISDFEIIPKNLDGHLQAVSLWQNQEQALAFVAERIREAIQKR